MDNKQLTLELSKKIIKEFQKEDNSQLYYLESNECDFQTRFLILQNAEGTKKVQFAIKVLEWV